MMAEKPSTTIVLPTRNEEGNILGLLGSLLASLAEWPGAEILVVDASTDGTADLVREYAKDHPQVVLVRQEGQGLRNALLQGAGTGRAQQVLVMDADGQHPVDAAVRLLEAAGVNRAPLVVGTRYGRGGGMRNWSLARRWLSRAATWTARWCVPGAANCSDPMSGLFLVDRTWLERLPPERTGWKLLLEILAQNPGAPVSEVPYVFGPRTRGHSKLGARTIRQNLQLLFQLSPGLHYAARALLVCVVLWCVLFASGAATGGRWGRGSASLTSLSGDAGIYLSLSQGVYQGDRDAPFLPLYPMLIATTAPLLGGSAPAAALVLSFLGACCGLWVVQAFADAVLGPGASGRALWYAAVSPVSFFLLNGYSEGVFFGLSALALWYGCQRRWPDAGLVGGLAALTRSAGVFLFPALLVALLANVWKKWAALQWRDLVALLLIPVAFAGVAIAIGNEAQGPLSLWKVEHGVYGRQWAPPWVGAWLTLRAAAVGPVYWRLLNASKLFYGLGWPALLVAGWKRLPAFLSAYVVCGLVLLGNIAPHEAMPWLSLDRFLLPVFPAYLTMAAITRRPAVHVALSVTCVLLLAAQWVLFVNGFWG